MDEKTTEGGREIALVLTGTLPEISGNFEACRSWYLAELERYQGVVDPEKLPEAKADLTKLRAEVKRLDRIRIDEAKRLKAPISAMEKQVESLTALINQTIDKIALQVKACEEKTRRTCAKLMLETLCAEYMRLEVRDEYRTGAAMIEPMIGISKVTAGGALTKAARESIEGLAVQGRAAQDKADGRMSRVEADCRAAGVEPFTREYVVSFLDADDFTFSGRLKKLIDLEVQRAAAAKEKQAEEIRRQEREKLKADADAAEKKRKDAQMEADRLDREAKEEAARKLEPHNREDPIKTRVEEIHLAMMNGDPTAAILRGLNLPTGNKPQDQTEDLPTTPNTKNTPTIQPVPPEGQKNETADVIVSASFRFTTPYPIDHKKICSWFEEQICKNPELKADFWRVVAFDGKLTPKS